MILGLFRKYFNILGINEADFSWERYLDETKSEAAPEHLFREVREILRSAHTVIRYVKRTLYLLTPKSI